MERPVRTLRNGILLGQHLEDVRQTVEKSQQAKAKYVGAVGANPVLDQSGLLALYPGVKSREVQDGEKNDAGQGEFNSQNF